MRIHFIAIGGSIMHNLALALKQQGHDVSGSDDIIYDPAKSNLERAGMLPENGWHTDRITNDIDLVILGMHAKKDNEELLMAQKLGLTIMSFPEYLGVHGKDKKRIAICGSHGKTTTTSMVMHILKYHGIHFDFAVGAKIDGYELMVGLSDAPIIIIEGDEYLSSALDPRPKFLHYNPHIATITGVEWDHINVFPTINDYLDSFRALIKSITAKDSALIYNASDPDVVNLVESTPIKCRKIPYEAVDYFVNKGQYWITFGKESTSSGIIGDHNMENLGAAWQVCFELGLSNAQIFQAIKTYEPPSIRLNIIEDTNDHLVIRDFAHSPSKVKASVRAAKKLYPERKLVAILELHTYSSLNREFLAHYEGTLAPADKVCIFYNPKNLTIKKLPSIDKSFIHQSFDHPNLEVAANREELDTFVDDVVDQKATYLLMSSSNFGGLDIKRFCVGK